MTYHISDLADLGWNTFYSSQLETDDLEYRIPVRVTEVHRSRILVAGVALAHWIPPFRVTGGCEEMTATVGDWLLLDANNLRAEHLLKRKSLFKRRAPGRHRKIQLIAANIDTLFIVSSCNQDFNAARLERYLALAHEEDVTPVIVLTKADLTEKPEDFAKAANIMPDVMVETVNARDPQSTACLVDWCSRGQTAALVGSSGVGKSTLINTLTGEDHIRTQTIRDDDAKGRHTTTGRTFHSLPSGGWLLDTPGMRELQLTDVRSGLEEVFSDIEDLANNCRFADCAHDSEPACAVRKAVQSGELDARRLTNWRKLMAEEAYNSETLAERRQRHRVFSKMVRRAKNEKLTNRRD